MLGKNHAKSGAVVWLAGAAGWAAAGLPVSAVPVAAGAVVAAYAARLPDIDHPGATVSRTWGAPLRLVYRLVRGLVWLVVAVTGGRKRARRVVREWFGHRCITHTAVFAAAVGLLFAPLILWRSGLWWVGPAVGTGTLVHTFGDMLTNSGCPVWAPWSWERRSARWFRVGGWGERKVVARLLYGLLCVEVPLIVVLAGRA